MKKFMKGCAIAALVFVVLGVVLAAAAGSIRGRIGIEDTVRAVTGGRINLKLGADSEDWGLIIEEDGREGAKSAETGEGYYNIEDSDIFSKEYDIVEGDVEKYSLGNDIGKLDVEIGGCALYIQESSDDTFYLEAKNMRKMQSFVKNGTLHIKALRTGKVWDESRKCEIFLYVPANYSFSEAELEVGAGYIATDSLIANEVSLEAGAGSIEADSVQAQKLDVSVGAGAISVADMNVQDVSGEVGVGYLYLEGEINRKAEMECSMGSLELYVRGAQTDFNYQVEYGMGNLEIGEDSYSGLARETFINNQAGKNMDLECAMGSITVEFDR